MVNGSGSGSGNGNSMCSSNLFVVLCVHLLVALDSFLTFCFCLETWNMNYELEAE